MRFNLDRRGMPDHADGRVLARTAVGVAIVLAAGILAAIFGSATRSSAAAESGTVVAISLEERVRLQRLYDRFIWDRRLWPRENKDPRPLFDDQVPESVTRDKVGDMLRQSLALEKFWDRPIAPAMLQRELDRMAAATRDPALLRQVFALFGNDPATLAECLARPILVERMIRAAYGYAPPCSQSGSRREISPGFEQWWRSVRDGIPADQPPYAWDYSLPVIGDGSGRSNTWSALPSGFTWRNGATAFWTGSEVLLWGVGHSTSPDTGARYDPLTDTWMEMTTVNGPPPFYVHSAVWTGSEMIVWGRLNGTAAIGGGARYSPATDSWQAMPTAGSVAISSLVWTGNQMIAWSNDQGARYDSSANSWVTMTTRSGLGTRYSYSVVWDGERMLVWGGNYGSNYYASGAEYNLANNNWTLMPAAPSGETGRSGHAAVWAGHEMLVWGGTCGTILRSGLGYNPVTRRWRWIESSQSPAGSTSVQGIWTSQEMIVWLPDQVGTADIVGGMYRPDLEAWLPMSAAGVTTWRTHPCMVLTDRELIVWGGQGSGSTNLADGERYDLELDSWRSFGIESAPSDRAYHTAVWDGIELLVWGGYDGSPPKGDGARYVPYQARWHTLSTVGDPSARYHHTALWTGGEMLVWGGVDSSGGAVNSGSRYDPATDSWTSIATQAAPTNRLWHAAVWDGRGMIVWGGNATLSSSNAVNTGGRYDPLTNSWTATATVACPSNRWGTAAVWTGSTMIVWGGTSGSSTLKSGGRYDPQADSWLTMTTVNGPAAASWPAVAWTGTRMIVWGSYPRGGIYDPLADSWQPLSTVNSPTVESGPYGCWTGEEMIVWGSRTYDRNNGGIYNPVQNAWRQISTVGAPQKRCRTSATWTASAMMVWGGYQSTTTTSDYLHDGTAYYPNDDPGTLVPLLSFGGSIAIVVLLSILVPRGLRRRDSGGLPAERGSA